MEYIKKNLYFNIGALIIGAVALIAALIIYDNSTLFGGGVAFIAVGLCGIIQCVILMKNPDKCEEVNMMKNEERSVYIREKTNSKVYSIFVYIESALCLISGIMGYKEITLILAALVGAKLLVWMIVGTMVAKEN